MQPLATGAFTQATANAIAQMLAQAGIFTTGNVFYLDPVNGDDGFNGQTPTDQGDGANGPVKTLAQGYALLTSGNNDVLVLIANGATSGTARIGAKFTWAKSETIMLGMCSPAKMSQRARIANNTTDVAYANFFEVSGNGCYFKNIQWFQGFTLGVASEICMKVSGQRNVFDNCHFAGMGDGDGAGGADTGSRNLLVTAGENLFAGCTIGLDTVARTVANASVEISGNAARNIFRDCLFIFFATNAAVLGVKTGAAAAIDRMTLFDSCSFINSIKSGAGTAMTALVTMAAAAGGLLAFRDALLVGVSALGTDATTKAQIYAFGPANNTSSFIAANPA